MTQDEAKQVQPGDVLTLKRALPSFGLDIGDTIRIERVEITDQETVKFWSYYGKRKDLLWSPPDQFEAPTGQFFNELLTAFNTSNG